MVEGNALQLAYDITDRASLDIDFSMENADKSYLNFINLFFDLNP